MIQNYLSKGLSKKLLVTVVFNMNSGEVASDLIDNNIEIGTEKWMYFLNIKSCRQL